MFKPVAKEQLTVPGHHDYMPDLREFVSRVGRKYRLTLKLINTLKLAVDEAATNIIEHAYQDQQSHITIQAFVQSKAITIVLIDQGPFFDPNWAEEPDLFNSAETGERPHLGIFLLRKLIDKIEYTKTDAGNELRLTKYRKAPKKGVRIKPLISSLPVLKSPYFLSIIGIFTVITISFFFYLYNKAEVKRISDFLFTGKRISNRIANHLGSMRADFLKTADGRLHLKTFLHPIYEEKVWQIQNFSVTDTSKKIVWSTKSAEVQMPFKRPSEVTYITDGIFNYSVDGVAVYEFERTVFPRKKGAFSGKVRVLFFKDYFENQIKIAELHYLRNGLIVLGGGYLIITLLAFLIPLGFLKSHKTQPRNAATKIDPASQQLNAFARNLPETEGTIRKIPDEGFETEPEKQIEPESQKIDETASNEKKEHPSDSPAHGEVTAHKPNYNPLQLSAPVAPPSLKNKKTGKSEPELAEKASLIKTSLEFTLTEFLDRLNSSSETVKAVVTNFNKPVSEIEATEESTEASRKESAAEITETQAEKPVRSQKITDAKDTDLEIVDISDYLVDAIFNDHVRQKAAEDLQKEEERFVAPVDEATEVKTEEVEDEQSSKSAEAEKPKKEIKLLSAPAPAETSEKDHAETPGKTDSEIEADSILVQSLEDLFSRIKKAHSFISSEEEPSAEVVQMNETREEEAVTEPAENEPPAASDSEREAIESTEGLARGVQGKIETPPEPAEQAESFLIAGIQHYRKKQYEDAIIAFRNLLKIEPDSKNIHLLLGNSYFKNNMMTDALLVYKQYKEKYPGESIAHENLALIYEKQGAFQLALKEWRSASYLNNGRPDIKRKIEQAEKTLKAETQNGKSVQATQAYIKRPQTTAKQSKQNEQKNILLKEGIHYYRNKNFAAAISSFKVAIKLFPRFKEAHRFLGITYFRYKLFDESEHAFEKLKQLQAEDESIHENMGLIYAKQGAYRQALDEWKKILDVNPHRTDIKRKINKVVELL